MNTRALQGMRKGKPSREDVARSAGVSGTTVSRVLSDRTDFLIAPETRERVLAAAKELGYLPNPAARALMMGETRMIGFWASLAYSRYRGQVVDRMREVMAQTSYTLAITDVQEEIFLDHSVSRALRLPVDGTIAFDIPAAGDFFVRNMGKSSKPFPFVGMGAYWSSATSYVGVDLGKGATLAMRHLLSTGRKKIAHLFPRSPDGDLNEPRGVAYFQAMQESSLPTILIDSPDHSYEAAKKRFAEYVREQGVPEAVFCFNDDLALGAYRAIRELGLRVGEDVALVGCDGIEETDQVSCPITTIKQPIWTMCDLAWQYLRERMQDPTAPLRQTILTPELVIRASSGR